MRGLTSIITIGICIILCKSAIAQQTEENKRHSPMLILLYEQKELSNPKDTILSDLDVMYDRLILQTKRPGKSAKIYLFGTNSPHGKRFIDLNDHTGTTFLTTMDLPTDMKIILNFFKRNNINS